MSPTPPGLEGAYGLSPTPPALAEPQSALSMGHRKLQQRQPQQNQHNQHNQRNQHHQQQHQQQQQGGGPELGGPAGSEDDYDGSGDRGGDGSGGSSLSLAACAAILAQGHDQAIIDTVLRDVVQRDLGVTFDDIAALDTAKRLLNEAVILPLIMPEFFTGIREPWKVRREGWREEGRMFK